MFKNDLRFLRWSFLLVVTIGILSACHLTSEDAEALPGHAMSVSLVPPELDAKVTEDQLGAVTFGGNVTIEKQQGVERVTVTLTPDCIWPVVVNPQTMTFINPGTQRYQLTVIVPPATLVSSTSATVLAHANSPIWDEDQTAEVRVNVKQYFKMDLWSTTEVFDAEAGGTLMGTLNVNNSGNGDDTFQISVENSPIEGISNVQFADEQLLVQPGFIGEFSFTIFIDEDLDAGMDDQVLTVIFRVTSLSASQIDILFVKTLPVHLYFQGLESRLKEDWPTYVGYGVVATLIIVPVALILRRRKRRREPEPELPNGEE